MAMSLLGALPVPAAAEDGDVPGAPDHGGEWRHRARRVLDEERARWGGAVMVCGFVAGGLTTAAAVGDASAYARAAGDDGIVKEGPSALMVLGSAAAVEWTLCGTGGLGAAAALADARRITERAGSAGELRHRIQVRSRVAGMVSIGLAVAGGAVLASVLADDGRVTSELGPYGWVEFEDWAPPVTVGLEVAGAAVLHGALEAAAAARALDASESARRTGPRVWVAAGPFGLTLAW